MNADLHSGFPITRSTSAKERVTLSSVCWELHLVYGAQASPSEKNRQTVNDSPEATAMSWSMTTTPVNVPGYKATAHMLNEFDLGGAVALLELGGIGVGLHGGAEVLGGHQVEVLDVVGPDGVGLGDPHLQEP